MKNMILAILFVFSVVWSHDASARASKHKKKPSVSRQKHSAAKVKAKSGGKTYKSSYLRKKHNRSVASDSAHSKKAKKSKKEKSKKNRKHNG